MNVKYLKRPEIKKISNIGDLAEGDLVKLVFEDCNVHTSGQTGTFTRENVSRTENLIYFGENGNHIIFILNGGYGVENTFIEKQTTRARNGVLVVSGEVCITSDMYGRNEDYGRKCDLLESAGFGVETKFGEGGL
jgi:hypothetical protein